MTNALNKTNAATGALGPRFARLARRGLAVCMLACVGLGAAHAQSHGRRDDMQVQPPPSARGDRFASPQIDQREQRGYDQMRDQMRDQQQRAVEDQQRRQMQQEQNGRDGRRDGRLTPDERRDLRRQINEAGADIYPNARRR